MSDVASFFKTHEDGFGQIFDFEVIKAKHDASESTQKSRYAVRQIYMDLMLEFDKAFPKILSVYQLLYWGFMRTKLADTYIETDERREGERILRETLEAIKKFSSCSNVINVILDQDGPKPNYSKEEFTVLSSVTGLLQTLMNLLAACLSGPHMEAGERAEDESTPLFWLTCAKRLYELYVEHNDAESGPEYWETILSEGLNYEIKGSTESTDSTLPPTRLLLEHGYTTTIFMLAQAYRILGEEGHSAACCQLTLSRQLTYAHQLNVLPQPDVKTPEDESMDFQQFRTAGSLTPVTILQQFDPVEWAMNAAILGSFYLSRDDNTSQYFQTLECLASAYAVLGSANFHLVPNKKCCVKKASSNKSSSVDEGKSYHRRIANAQADLARCWSHLGLILLERGGERFEEKLNNQSQSHYGETETQQQEFAENSRNFGSMFQLRLQPVIQSLLSSCAFAGPTSSEQDLSGTSNPVTNEPYVASDFSSLVMTLACPPSDYESAARIFRFVLHFLNLADTYYTMNERCSDAVELTRKRCKAYCLISVFEPVITRKCCMQKRRIDLIQGVLKQLNVQHYLMVCRQLMFDLAEALNSLRALKKLQYDEAVKAKSKKSSYYAAKVNGLTKQAIGVYRDFLDTFRHPREPSLPKTFSEEDIRCVMLAHFYTARLYSCLIPVDKRDRCCNVNRSLETYIRLINMVDCHLRSHPNSPVIDADEVTIAREMVTLLPAKLSRLSRGEDFTE